LRLLAFLPICPESTMTASSVFSFEAAEEFSVAFIEQVAVAEGESGDDVFADDSVSADVGMDVEGEEEDIGEIDDLDDLDEDAGAEESEREG